MAVCLSQLYHDHKRGINAGYAKFETFPIWNLPLKHPVNLAYEAATADLADVNMIDSYHLEAYGMTAVNYNRDIEIYPVLRTIFERIYGECPYKSPTDMGVNMAGYCIFDDEACCDASKQEIIRRYFRAMVDQRQGKNAENVVQKIELLMNSLKITPDIRKPVAASLEVAERLAKEGIDCEVIDPRTIVPLDIDTIVNSVKKTGRCVVVHEAHKTCGIGAEIASQIMENAFEYLDAPVIRLGAKSCPLPFNLNLENAVVPQPDDIYNAVKKSLWLA